MEDKIKSKKKNGEIRIITDKQRNSEYTFVDDGLTNSLPNSSPNHSNDDNLSSYSFRRHSDKLKKNSADYKRFKSSKITKAQSK
jgi:hypothetical protein